MLDKIFKGVTAVKVILKLKAEGQTAKTDGLPTLGFSTMVASAGTWVHHP